MDPIAALCFTPRIRLEIGRRNARKWIKRDDARAHRGRDRKTQISKSNGFNSRRGEEGKGREGYVRPKQRAKWREKLGNVAKKYRRFVK